MNIPPAISRAGVKESSRVNQRWHITGLMVVLATILPMLLPVSGQTSAPATVTVTMTASVTATPTPQPTATASATRTATATRTVTHTATATASHTPSATPTAQPSPTPAVTVITGTPRPTNTRFPTNTVMPTLAPTFTPRIVTAVVTSPPQIITAVVPATPVPESAESDGTGTDEQPDNRELSEADTPTENTDEEYGWRITQSEDLVRTVGQWPVRHDTQANAGAKSVSANAGAVMTFPFEGSGFMVIYEVFAQGKPFQVVIDGEVQQLVDTQSGGGREPGFYVAGPF